MNEKRHQPVRLDLNNSVFQRQLFNLLKIEQHNILNTLRKLATMIWQQVYVDHGLKWEAILSKKGQVKREHYQFVKAYPRGNGDLG